YQARCKTMKIGSRRIANGFTLLEVLMAVGLLAVISALVISTMSGGLRQVRWSSQASEASMHAQSLLDTIGTMEFIEPDTKQGSWEEGKYRYQLDIKEVPDPSLGADTPVAEIETISPPVLYQIILLVSWGDKPQEQLRFVSYKARQAAANNIDPVL
ncbi:MAG: prepilin-type N-terminal cleavage/methylation domain-containing protein, partial [Arenimonas sp.]